MLKAPDARAQRRKLLREMVRFADVAVFGTLSETYRTCGGLGVIATDAAARSMGRISRSAIEASMARPRAITCRKARKRRRGRAWRPGNTCNGVCASWRI